MFKGKCAISSERKGQRTSKLVRRRRTKTRITDKRRDLQGQRSRSSGRLMLGSASYLPNGKAYELETWYTEGVRRSMKIRIKDKAQCCKVT